jgi:hypothetical protein
MKLLVTILTFLASTSFAQLSPEITSWILNQSGETGYGGIISNVQQVQYSDGFVYVSASCVPSYTIGPWPGNPNTPKNQNFVYKITRHPKKKNGSRTETPLGHVGVWINGVSIFNAKDARSYKDEQNWFQNAIVVEGSSFDDCLGHPAPNGEYHHHLNPRCLYDDKDSSKHSPIIGYSFDGFPIYGAYGYANTDGTGKITRMRSTYRLRSITDRTTFWGGAVLKPYQYGPPISAEYPLGYFVEDFEIVEGIGDLDINNGRFCITPEHPLGTYAYFVTLDEKGEAAYPYTLGTWYYGEVTPGNTGPNSGHATITEAVNTYSPSSVESDVSTEFSASIFPNPASSVVSLFVAAGAANNMHLTVTSTEGKIVYTQDNIQPAVQYTLDVSSFAEGLYFISIQSESAIEVRRIVVAK